MLYHQYLSPEALDGFKTYKYNCKDTNPLSIYVLHPFWDRCVLLCPRWIAPNLLTLVGFLCCVASYALPAYYDPKYHSDARYAPLSQRSMRVFGLGIVIG